MNLTFRKSISWCALCLLTAFADSGSADDLTPPHWRGQASATIQKWDFLFQDTGSKKHGSSCAGDLNQQTPWGQSGTPEFIDNQYEKITGICTEFKSLWMISQKLDWLAEHNDRRGIWHLQSDRSLPVFLNFIIPNAGPLESQESEIQVQITYESKKAHPGVEIKYFLHESPGSFASFEPVDEFEDRHLPGDWTHRVYRFKTDWCPKFEVIQITPPERSNIYIDEVVVDTICREVK